MILIIISFIIISITICTIVLCYKQDMFSFIQTRQQGKFEMLQDFRHEGKEGFVFDKNKDVVRLIQHGNDGFGHQMLGLIGLMSLHNVGKYYFDAQTMLNKPLKFEHIKDKDLPEIVNKHFQKRRHQNKQAAQLLHFRCDSKIIAKEFMPGFKEIQHQTFFNLTPFVRFMKKGEGKHGGLAFPPVET